MTDAPEKARILIATDSVRDAELLARLLEVHFENVRVSTVAENACKDFEAHSPDVLVLAFDSIAKAQVYYLGLYRLLPFVNEHRHRSVLLCTKDEVPKAFELCRQQRFDDYVLYWPLAYDGFRLPMTIWSACREMMQLRADEHRSSTRLEHDVASAESRPLPGTVDALRTRLLVVDDDEMVPALVSGALDAARYELSFAASGAEAISMLRLAHPDLILMDFRLPGTDGISLTRQLKASPDLAAIPIIMMTTDSRRETVQGSIDAGAGNFLVKPFTRQSLQSKIDSTLIR